MPVTPRSCPRSHMLGYSVGEGANSLIMNSLYGFAMLYYTDALGLKHSDAGIAMALAVFWDAVTDPMMGHITDNTRSRFGRRHPYILLGGLAAILTYLFLWIVPGIFSANASILFWYLVVINLLQRTAITVYWIPYTALGFEMCSDYQGRVSLQGIRAAVTMLANFLGPGLAWAIFFADNDAARATSVPENYVRMGLGFAAVSLLCVLTVVFLTRRYIRDSRGFAVSGESPAAFYRNMKEIVTDSHPRFVFLFILIVTVGIALVSSLQMYLYEHFMRFGGVEKSIAHGGSMVGFGVGSLLAPLMTRRWEKVRAVQYAVTLSVSCNFLLALFFLPGLLTPGGVATIWAVPVPYVFILFTLLHAHYWLGNGILFPTATSMMADVSEIHEIHTGVNKDGAYAAVFSFVQKVAISLAVLVSGYILSSIGFEAGTEVTQDSGTLWRLCAVTLLLGPVISLAAVALIRRYPVNAAFLDALRARHHS